LRATRVIPRAAGPRDPELDRGTAISGSGLPSVDGSPLVAGSQAQDGLHGEQRREDPGSRVDSREQTGVIRDGIPEPQDAEKHRQHRAPSFRPPPHQHQCGDRRDPQRDNQPPERLVVLGKDTEELIGREWEFRERSSGQHLQRRVDASRHPHEKRKQRNEHCRADDRRDHRGVQRQQLAAE